ncbi:MAG: methyltransferase domain-containing protein, partial [Chitinophagaceae bacterium]|nr:methyltransferase domain-containing protein [Chitinophagaceae bacterium]
TAIDNLPEYIDEVKSVAEKEKLSIQANIADVTQLQTDGYFDVCICMGDSFSFFNEADALRVLANVLESLKPSGYFIINSSLISEIIIRNFKEKNWFYVDGYKYLIDNKYLFRPTRVETDHIIIAPDGETELIKGIDYIFSFSEMEELLRKAGFEVREIYSTPRKRKYRFGDNQAYIVAEKS